MRRAIQIDCLAAPVPIEEDIWHRLAALMALRICNVVGHVAALPRALPRMLVACFALLITPYYKTIFTPWLLVKRIVGPVGPASNLDAIETVAGSTEPTRHTLQIAVHLFVSNLRSHAYPRHELRAQHLHTTGNAGIGLSAAQHFLGHDSNKLRTTEGIYAPFRALINHAAQWSEGVEAAPQLQQPTGAAQRRVDADRLRRRRQLCAGTQSQRRQIELREEGERLCAALAPGSLVVRLEPRDSTQFGDRSNRLWPVEL